MRRRHPRTTSVVSARTHLIRRYRDLYDRYRNVGADTGVRCPYGWMADRLEAGHDFECSAWQLPAELRETHQLRINDRVRLVGDEVHLLERYH